MNITKKSQQTKLDQWLSLIENSLKESYVGSVFPNIVLIAHMFLLLHYTNRVFTALFLSLFAVSAFIRPSVPFFK